MKLEEMMIDERLLELAELAKYHVRNGARKGQSLMLALHQMDPALYTSLSGSEFDPFYDDVRVATFLAEVILRWTAK